MTAYLNAYADLKEQIIPQAVDSIIIKMLFPNVETCFSSLSFDRDHFDEIYDYYSSLYTDHKSGAVFKIKLTTWYEVSMFIAMLNYLPALSDEEISVLPNEIPKEETPDWLPIDSDVTQNMDNQLVTRTKIDIYYTDGSVKTAFTHKFYLDIDNWRYHTTMDFRMWLRHYIPNNGTFSKNKYIPRKEQR